MADEELSEQKNLKHEMNSIQKRVRNYFYLILNIPSLEVPLSYFKKVVVVISKLISVPYHIAPHVQIFYYFCMYVDSLKIGRIS